MDLKKTIKRQGFTLDGVAQEMGISKSAMSQIVNGNPTYSKLQEIATIIGISVSELVSDETDSRTSTLRCPHCGKEIQVEIK
ncbi:MAG: helix-turn-helix transcriptional regulator [Bacteroidaceae bacterium]|nr:helix-turn-helix transcriptional regulator [Bacteroidaceae bacterium]